MIRGMVGVPAGRWTKWLVLVFWLVIVALAGPLSGKLTGAEKNDAQSWLPPKAESTQVLALRSKVVSPNVYPAVVVYDRPGGLTAADKAKAAADARRFAGVAGVVQGQVAGPFVARDGQAIETIVPVNLGHNGWNGAGAAADSLRSIAASDARGLTIHIAGPLGYAADSGKAFKGIDGTLLFSALAVVILLLLITYRSPTLWLLPVISAAVALTTSQAVIYLLAAHAGLTVNAQSAGILDVLVFGAGTDYALLLTARYREELRRHEDRHEAMRVAIRRAGPAIVASGGTVILSLLALTFAELNSTKGLGPVLAIGVGVALLAMITLLPALLVITGRWVFWPAKPGIRLARADGPGLLGADRPPHRRASAARLDHHRRAARCHGPRADRAEGERADQRGVVPRPPGLGDRAGRPRPALPGRSRAAGRGLRQPGFGSRSSPRRSGRCRASPA